MCQRTRILLQGCFLLWVLASSSLAQENAGAPVPIAKPSRVLPKGEFGTGFRLSPNGKWIAVWDVQSSNGFFGGGSTQSSDWSVANARDPAAEPISRPGIFQGLEFSPDSKHLLAWDSKAVEVIDLDTAKTVATLPHEKVQSIQCFAGDKRLVTCSGGSTLFQTTPVQMKFWDMQTWKAVVTGVDQHFPILLAILSPDGKMLAGVTTDGAKKDVQQQPGHVKHQLKVWNVATGNEQPGPKHDASSIAAIGFTYDGKGLVSNYSGYPRYWDFSTGQSGPFPPYLNPNHHVNWSSGYFSGFLVQHGISPDRIQRRVQLIDNRWVVWDVPHREKLREFENSTPWRPQTVATAMPSSDTTVDMLPVLENSVLAVHYQGADSGQVNVWDLDTKKVLRSLETDRPVQQMSLSKDGKTLAVLDYEFDPKTLKYDCQVSVWDLATGKQQYVLKGHDDLVRSLAFSPDMKLLATASGLTDRRPRPGWFQSGEINLWNAATGELLRTFGEKGTPVYAVAFSPDNKQLATGSLSKAHQVLRFWNTATGELDREVRFECPRVGFESLGPIHSLAYVPDGKTLAVTSGHNNDGFLSLWDVATGKFLFDHRPDHPVRCLLFTTEGTSLLSGQQFLDLSKRKLWDRPKYVLPEGSVFGAISDTHVASISREHGYGAHTGVVQLWNSKGANDGRLKTSTGPIQAVTFSPDGKTLIAGGAAARTSVLKLIDLETGRDLATIKGITAPQFSPDGKWMATRDLILGGQGMTICDTRSGRELGFIPHEGLQYFRISRDGKALATLGKDLRVWDLTEILGK